MHTTQDKALFVVLLLACLIAVGSLYPLLFSLGVQGIDNLKMDARTLLFMSFLQNLVLFSIAIYTGLRLAPLVGLRLPFLRAWVQKEKLPASATTTLTLSAIIGLLVGIMAGIGDGIFRLAGISVILDPPAPLGYHALALLYGAIAEEILVHFFLMTLIAWLLMRVTQSPVLYLRHVWTAIIISSLFFALGHLPLTATLSALSNGIVLRTLLLNGVSGIVFGWLYWKNGLESAMVAHFFADVALLVIMVVL